MIELNAILMLEILGRPAEHIKKTLSEIVKRLGEEKDVKLLNKRIAEPKRVEGQEDLFTSFAEVELSTNLQKLMAICFGYMPSHVEIISPEDPKMKNNDLNMFLNEMIRRLHQYDELAKALMLERQALAKKIKEGEIKVQDKPLKKVSKKQKKKVRRKKKT